MLTASLSQATGFCKPLIVRTRPGKNEPDSLTQVEPEFSSVGFGNSSSGQVGVDPCDLDFNSRRLWIQKIRVQIGSSGFKFKSTRVIRNFTVHLVIN